MRLLFFALMAARLASATVLFSDNFESECSGTLSSSLWSNAGSGFVTTDPLSSGNGCVLSMANQGSGGDVFSILSNYPVANGGNVNLSFDFYEPQVAQSGQLGFAGFDHQPFCCSNEYWAWNASSGGNGNAPAPVGQWTHVSMNLFPLTFSTTPVDTRPFNIKFENAGSSPGSPVSGLVYFDNIVLTSVPEPATILGGALGLIAVAAGRRRNSR